MNISELSKKFNTQQKCINHLEKVRWGDSPTCPYCQTGDQTSKRKDGFRWICNYCGNSFSVFIGTIFEDTNLPLPIWFQLIALMINSKTGISSCEIARNLGITQKTAWYNAMKVRCAMLDQSEMLTGICEMDEAYLGGSPRRGNQLPDNVPSISTVTSIKSKRGRGTKKIPVVGIVQRKGHIATKIIGKLTSRNLLAMLRKHVAVDRAVLITDSFSSYNKFDEVLPHLTIEHQEAFKKGIIDTNTIESFWSILKNGIKGNYRAVSKKYLPFYLAEYSYKYNKRDLKDIGFKETVENAVEEEKCFVNYKPKKEPKKLAYGRKGEK